ncbi:CYTH domain-containing protein [Microvirga sp. HBU67558]|uniref:CYTH domain-containing protein n=1 Tax=Microvirga TaxID=186650 RepID=UPI001B374C8E|nr:MULTISPECIES: CYTH domain-containing protein [unclassified Microvirga]MBQ0822912.1 CYTH domain-containing protein [Microvirga sp. HBU67558]
MPVEIERKFLVKSDEWRKPEPGQRYRQGYLCKGEVTVRVRCGASRGFLTIKGGGKGLGRPEFEYEIPLDEAEELLKLCPRPLIEKVRHEVLHAGMVWHVDEFAGENAGLVLAEVELRHPGQAVVLPDWVGEEVTSDERFRNSRLADVPWGKGWGGPPPKSRPLRMERSGSAIAPTRVLANGIRPRAGSTGQDEASGTPVRGQWKDAQEKDGAP